ncbi:C4-dicarboxylate transporter, DctM subunit [Anaerosphaera aminiphila DSM 21120]|uniref:C4-dicarboxylate transporter, DctM subunit n=1 Tax=Anaerosphaera aminiphila DSM 21120 TaxID=1120995 RepID=A0A1M5QNH7_9FIRM|nr:TRAP transporter large permease [Anaerosphaera aminiphila]SHH15359.1 C4-dicarboxylate transporter, DctM subunit [Anaerosphaera aminiphila DSM 21120]
MVGIMFALMLGLIFIGVPVAFSILGSGIFFLTVTDMKPLMLVAQRVITGLDSFPLLAVPLFILVGELMDRGGISKRMTTWAESLLGWLPGGLGIVTIVSCAIFAALTGSGPATVAAIGGIMIPSLVKNGYSLKTAAGMSAAGGALGPIIPPSIPMIIYGVTMGLSIPKMFIAGIVPGIILMLVLIGVNIVIALKNPEILKNRSKTFSIKEVLKNTWSALGALLLPVIILGGIYSGIFTPTEAAAVGVVYALFVGMFVYKEFKISDLPSALLKSMGTAAMVDIIIAAANLLSWIMSVTEVSTIIVAKLSTFINNQFTYLLILMLILFIVGALMDTVAAIIILAPVIVPLGIELGLDPLHLGMIFVINLVIGYVTPPFGYNLFTASSITGLKFNEVVRGVLPFLLVEMAAVMLFAFVPQIIMWLPNLLG